MAVSLGFHGQIEWAAARVVQRVALYVAQLIDRLLLTGRAGTERRAKPYACPSSAEAWSKHE
jgi:hypothetical protein